MENWRTRNTQDSEVGWRSRKSKIQKIKYKIKGISLINEQNIYYNSIFMEQCFYLKEHDFVMDYSIVHGASIFLLYYCATSS